MAAQLIDTVAELLRVYLRGSHPGATEAAVASMLASRTAPPAAGSTGGVSCLPYSIVISDV